MSAPFCPARRALRLTLRAVDAHITSSSGSPVWRQHVLAAFKGNGGEGRTAARPSDAHERLRTAEEYSALVNAVHAHKELLFDYGHSLDKEREQLKKASSTARFVGLEMPPVYEEADAFLEGGGEKRGGDAKDGR